ncbi:UDP-N-acetylmuramate--L-alanine ligase [Candidatus Parcubacteria bacterium]|nr:MAG: UDP-N-acetylmuramate--L-alanine ligase [Candidatus Parcubacteria bacterium]
MARRVHFVGIGGIGVSALARLYRARGMRVSGSDLTRSEITDALRRDGIAVRIGPHRADHIPAGTATVIATPAARHDNPELAAARRRGIRVRSYEDAVGELTREYRTIAVAGAHGKSTTTALVALALARARFDPTVLIGTKLREFRNGNFRQGRSPWFVLEADEYKKKFLAYAPAIAVVTNIDREHLDTFGTMAGIEAAFLTFLRRINPRGIAVLNADDAHLVRIGRKLKRARPDIRIRWFTLKTPAARAVARLLQIPGRHNVANALAAEAAARAAGAPIASIRQAFHAYQGAWRRFQFVGTLAGAIVISDYAHHPTEIRATLAAARDRFPGKRIISVFQPHHTERLTALFREFVGAFDQADRVIILDTYAVAGRERARRPVKSAQALAAALARRGKDAHFAGRVITRHQLRAQAASGDVLLIMGAGSIGDMATAAAGK